MRQFSDSRDLTRSGDGSTGCDAVRKKPIGPRCIDPIGVWHFGGSPLTVLSS